MESVVQELVAKGFPEVYAREIAKERERAESIRKERDDNAEALRMLEAAVSSARAEGRQEAMIEACKETNEALLYAIAVLKHKCDCAGADLIEAARLRFLSRMQAKVGGAGLVGQGSAQGRNDGRIREEGPGWRRPSGEGSYCDREFVHGGYGAGPRTGSKGVHGCVSPLLIELYMLLGIASGVA
jgi:hypothetical protein